MTAQIVIGAVDRDKKFIILIFDTKGHKFDLDPGFISWPAHCSVSSQGQSSKQLLQEQEITFEWIKIKITDQTLWQKKISLSTSNLAMEIEFKGIPQTDPELQTLHLSFHFS